MPLRSYEAFPTLFDDIIAEADFATEVALRLCCKSLRDAVDRKQVRHLVLTPSGKDGTAVRGPVHRVAALRRLSPKSVSRLSGPMRELLKHVGVLDVRGFFPATCNLTHYKKTFPALSIVRLCTRKGEYTPYVPVGARTLVVFTSPRGSDCNPKANTGGADSMDALMDTFSAMFGDGPAPGPVVPRGIDPSGLPKTVRCIVVNMNGEDYAVAEMHHFVLDPPEQVEEIVILLPRVKDEGGRLAGQVVSQEKFAIKIIAMDLAELMVSVPGLRWTLVGLEHAHRIPDAFRALLRKQFEGYQFGEVEYAEEPTLVQLPDGKYDLRMDCKEPEKHTAVIEDMMDRLDILSFNEYVTKVGKSQAILETVEYEDGTVRDIGPRGIVLNDIRRMGPAAQE